LAGHDARSQHLKASQPQQIAKCQSQDWALVKAKVRRKIDCGWIVEFLQQRSCSCEEIVEAVIKRKNNTAGWKPANVEPTDCTLQRENDVSIVSEDLKSLAQESWSRK
jgi:hypothetical protein